MLESPCALEYETREINNEKWNYSDCFYLRLYQELKGYTQVCLKKYVIESYMTQNVFLIGSQPLIRSIKCSVIHHDLEIRKSIWYEDM